MKGQDLTANWKNKTKYIKLLRQSGKWIWRKLHWKMRTKFLVWTSLDLQVTSKSVCLLLNVFNITFWTYGKYDFKIKKCLFSLVFFFFKNKENDVYKQMKDDLNIFTGNEKSK